MSFVYLIFIIQKTLFNENRKDKSIINIENLNDLIFRNDYAPSLQTKIINILINYLKGPLS